MEWIDVAQDTHKWWDVVNALINFQIIQCVPLATEPSISLIILTQIKILQRNLNRSTFVV